MRVFRKTILKDEADHPIAVQIDYQDWLEIERELSVVPNGQHGSIFDLAGKLTWKGDATAYQSKLRSEWPL